MQAYSEGIFGTSEERLRKVFPLFQIAPTVGYTFAETPNWKPNYGAILNNMEQSRSILESLHVPDRPRFEIMPTPAGYVNELLYFCNLYMQLSRLGSDVAQCRVSVMRNPLSNPKSCRTSILAMLGPP